MIRFARVILHNGFNRFLKPLAPNNRKPESNAIIQPNGVKVMTRLGIIFRIFLAISLEVKALTLFITSFT